MYGDGIRQLQLVQHIEGVSRNAVVKANHHALLLRKNADDLADVAVEHAGSLLIVTLFFPHDVVVVSHLHHAVALAENGVSEALFQLAFTWWIECLLQTAVERNGSAAVPLGRRKHLYLCRSEAVVLGQSLSAKLCHRFDNRRRLRPFHNEKVAVRAGWPGHFTRVDRVRVHDNIRLLRLTENLGQLNGRHPM